MIVNFQVNTSTLINLNSKNINTYSIEEMRANLHLYVLFPFAVDLIVPVDLLLDGSDNELIKGLTATRRGPDL